MLVIILGFITLLWLYIASRLLKEDTMYRVKIIEDENGIRVYRPQEQFLLFWRKIKFSNNSFDAASKRSGGYRSLSEAKEAIEKHREDKRSIYRAKRKKVYYSY